jgi:molecular chaperone HtpG
MSTEKYQFQADVHQLLQLMIHSLYSNPEIFLRELISNASDSLDKLHLTSLTQKPLIASSCPKEIRLSVQKDQNQLIIEDAGIGLTKEEIQQNLGTIAKSGTKQFLENLKKQKEPQKAKLIGQFGVGFYSVFMVAEKVSVNTRSAYDEHAWSWTPQIDGTYEIHPIEKTEPGTQIVITLKKEHQNYLETFEIERLVKAYSNYIQYPIFWLEGDQKRQLNQGLPIWRHKPSDVSKEQQTGLYRQLGGYGDPNLSEWIHLEGRTEFHALMFLPEQASLDLFNSGEDYGPKLLTNGVVIQENCKELLPSFLRFFKGILETNDLDLNISREMLQVNANIHLIRKHLTKKILQALKKLSSDQTRYTSFIEQFGAILKEGAHTHPEYRKELLELVRYPSSRLKQGELTSLDEYISRMPEDQKEIFCLAAPNRSAAENSPHQEGFKQTETEILYWLDPVDEWIGLSLTDYKGHPLKLLHKGSHDTKPKETPEEEKDFLKRIQESLSPEIKEVIISNRLQDSPCCLVVPEEGLSSHMEMLFQARNKDYKPALKTFELNLTHPLIQNLKTLEAEAFDEQVWFLFNSALLAEGLPLNEPGKFAKKLYNFFSKGLS